jgi:hypothetical protein
MPHFLQRIRRDVVSSNSDLSSPPTVSRRQAEKKRDAAAAAEESVVRVIRVPTSLRILQSTVATTTRAKNKI